MADKNALTFGLNFTDPALKERVTDLLARDELASLRQLAMMAHARGFKEDANTISRIADIFENRAKIQAYFEREENWEATQSYIEQEKEFAAKHFLFDHSKPKPEGLSAAKEALFAAEAQVLGELNQYTTGLTELKTALKAAGKIETEEWRKFFEEGKGKDFGYDGSVFHDAELESHRISEKDLAAHESFIKASKILYQMDTGKNWEDAADNNGLVEGETIGQWGINYMSRFENQTGKLLTVAFSDLENATPDQQMAFLYAYNTFSYSQNNWESFKRAVGYTAADPVTLVSIAAGLATGGLVTIASQSAKTAGVQTIKQIVIRSATSTTAKILSTTMAAEGTLEGGVRAHVTEKLNEATGRADYSLLNVVIGAGVGGITDFLLGGIIGAGADFAVRKISNSISGLFKSKVTPQNLTAALDVIDGEITRIYEAGTSPEIGLDLFGHNTRQIADFIASGEAPPNEIKNLIEGNKTAISKLSDALESHVIEFEEGLAQLKKHAKDPGVTKTLSEAEIDALNARIALTEKKITELKQTSQSFKEGTPELLAKIDAAANAENVDTTELAALLYESAEHIETTGKIMKEALNGPETVGANIHAPDAAKPDAPIAARPDAPVADRPEAPEVGAVDASNAPAAARPEPDVEQLSRMEWGFDRTAEVDADGMPIPPATEAVMQPVKPPAATVPPTAPLAEQPIVHEGDADITMEEMFASIRRIIDGDDDLIPPTAQRPDAPIAARPDAPAADRLDAPDAETVDPPNADLPESETVRSPDAETASAPDAPEATRPQATETPAAHVEHTVLQPVKADVTTGTTHIPDLETPVAPAADRPIASNAEAVDAPKAETPDAPNAARPSAPDAEAIEATDVGTASAAREAAGAAARPASAQEREIAKSILFSAENTKALKGNTAGLNNIIETFGAGFAQAVKEGTTRDWLRLAKKDQDLLSEAGGKTLRSKAFREILDGIDAPENRAFYENFVDTAFDTLNGGPRFTAEDLTKTTNNEALKSMARDGQSRFNKTTQEQGDKPRDNIDPETIILDNNNAGTPPPPSAPSSATAPSGSTSHKTVTGGAQTQHIYHVTGDVHIHNGEGGGTGNGAARDFNGAASDAAADAPAPTNGRAQAEAHADGEADPAARADNEAETTAVNDGNASTLARAPDPPLRETELTTPINNESNLLPPPRTTWMHRALHWNPYVMIGRIFPQTSNPADNLPNDLAFDRYILPFINAVDDRLIGTADGINTSDLGPVMSQLSSDLKHITDRIGGGSHSLTPQQAKAESISLLEKFINTHREKLDAFADSMAPIVDELQLEKDLADLTSQSKQGRDKGKHVDFSSAAEKAKQLIERYEGTPKTRTFHNADAYITAAADGAKQKFHLGHLQATAMLNHAKALQNAARNLTSPDFLDKYAARIERTLGNEDPRIVTKGFFDDLHLLTLEAKEAHLRTNDREASQSIIPKATEAKLQDVNRLRVSLRRGYINPHKRVMAVKDPSQENNIEAIVMDIETMDPSDKSNARQLLGLIIQGYEYGGDHEIIEAIERLNYRAGKAKKHQLLDELVREFEGPVDSRNKGGDHFKYFEEYLPHVMSVPHSPYAWAQRDVRDIFSRWSYKFHHARKFPGAGKILSTPGSMYFITNPAIYVWKASSAHLLGRKLITVKDPDGKDVLKIQWPWDIEKAEGSSNFQHFRAVGWEFAKSPLKAAWNISTLPLKPGIMTVKFAANNHVIRNVALYSTGVGLGLIALEEGIEEWMPESWHDGWFTDEEGNLIVPEVVPYIGGNHWDIGARAGTGLGLTIADYALAPLRWGLYPYKYASKVFLNQDSILGLGLQPEHLSLDGGFGGYIDPIGWNRYLGDRGWKNYREAINTLTAAITPMDDAQVLEIIKGADDATFRKEYENLTAAEAKKKLLEMLGKAKEATEAGKDEYDEKIETLEEAVKKHDEAVKTAADAAADKDKKDADAAASKDKKDDDSAADKDKKAPAAEKDKKDPAAATDKDKKDDVAATSGPPPASTDDSGSITAIAPVGTPPSGGGNGSDKTKPADTAKDDKNDKASKAKPEEKTPAAYAAEEAAKAAKAIRQNTAIIDDLQAKVEKLTLEQADAIIEEADKDDLGQIYDKHGLLKMLAKTRAEVQSNLHGNMKQVLALKEGYEDYYNGISRVEKFNKVASDTVDYIIPGSGPKAENLKNYLGGWAGGALDAIEGAWDWLGPTGQGYLTAAIGSWIIIPKVMTKFIDSTFGKLPLVGSLFSGVLGPILSVVGTALAFFAGGKFLSENVFGQGDGKHTPPDPRLAAAKATGQNPEEVAKLAARKAAVEAEAAEAAAAKAKSEAAKAQAEQAKAAAEAEKAKAEADAAKAKAKALKSGTGAQSKVNSDDAKLQTANFGTHKGGIAKPVVLQGNSTQGAMAAALLTPANDDSSSSHLVVQGDAKLVLASVAVGSTMTGTGSRHGLNNDLDKNGTARIEAVPHNGGDSNIIVLDNHRTALPTQKHKPVSYHDLVPDNQHPEVA